MSPGAAVAGAALPRPTPPPPRLTCVAENTVRQIKSKLIQCKQLIHTLNYIRQPKIKPSVNMTG